LIVLVIVDVVGVVMDVDRSVNALMIAKGRGVVVVSVSVTGHGKPRMAIDDAWVYLSRGLVPQFLPQVRA
jgi:hypothetical protein